VISGIPIDAPRIKDKSMTTWKDGDLPQINALNKIRRLEDFISDFVQ
jgi:hypothetical protein